MKRALILLVFSIGFYVYAQTNTNRIAGVSSLNNTNTNAVVFIQNGKYMTTSNNNLGPGYFLQAGNASSQPGWTNLSTTNLPGTIEGSRVVGQIQSGVTTNLDVVFPGPLTNTLRFTNGLLQAVTGPV